MKQSDVVKAVVVVGVAVVLCLMFTSRSPKAKVSIY